MPNVASHLLTHETITGAGETPKGVIAAVSLIPVLVIMVLELWVPAVRAGQAPSHETVSPVAEPAVIQPAVYHPVARDTVETIAVPSETHDDTPAVSHATVREIDETPEPVSLTNDETPKMDRETAMKIAEDAYAMPGTKTIEQVAKETGRSPATINRWRDKFREQGVKQLHMTTA